MCGPHLPLHESRDVDPLERERPLRPRQRKLRANLRRRPRPSFFKQWPPFLWKLQRWKRLPQPWKACQFPHQWQHHRSMSRGVCGYSRYALAAIFFRCPHFSASCIDTRSLRLTGGLGWGRTHAPPNHANSAYQEHRFSSAWRPRSSWESSSPTSSGRIIIAKGSI